MWISGRKGLRELCHGCLILFVNNAKNVSLFAMELEKSRKWQTNLSFKSYRVIFI